MRSPWLWFVGPFLAVLFPPLIPLLIILAIWQLTDGGERVAACIEGRRRDRDPIATIHHARSTRGPLPVGNDYLEEVDP